MSDWWETAYPGAPPPGGLIPLARPLYPPDAAKKGKTPSVEGVDVEAIKRSISRGGRWPWGAFDGVWSNQFAHGKPGGNVADSGAAGYQRQMDIDDSGWWGKKSNDSLQYALIPDGLPHAGEHLVDATARAMLREAYDRFEGHEPQPESEGTVRAAALAKAVTQLGVKESPPDSNHVKYCDWYGMVGPWCAMFCTYCYELGAEGIGKDSPSFVKGSRYAYVPYIVADARANRYGLTTTDDPVPGDLVCYDWGSGDTIYDHVGLFEKWLGSGSFDAIEGNTSYGNDSNGGEVMRRSRNTSSQGTVFVRVKEP